jgi:16S rRNA (cytosine967-C5)-methyltransferase
VYSTCTVSRRENEDPVAGILGQPGVTLRAEDLGRDHPELASRHDRRFVQTRPDRDRTDGFFIARLRREDA